MEQDLMQQCTKDIIKYVQDAKREVKKDDHLHVGVELLRKEFRDRYDVRLIEQCVLNLKKCGYINLRFDVNNLDMAIIYDIYI